MGLLGATNACLCFIFSRQAAAKAFHKSFSKYARQGRIVIVGSGWGGFELLRQIDRKAYEVIMVSPRNYFVFTPLLASTSVGTLEFRCVTEPIRQLDPLIKYHQAWCRDVDFQNQIITIGDCLDGNGEKVAQLEYDQLVLACGGRSNTFGIPGVEEHAFFLKDISDARRIRHRVLQCFELAMQPDCTDSLRRKLLHFAIVGGGPTGVEFAAELNDFIHDDMARIYPILRDYVRITVYDVAPRILGGFDEKLGIFAGERFARSGIRIETGKAVSSVGADYLTIAGDGRHIGTGLIVWATGLSPISLIKDLKGVKKTTRSMRIITDEHLRIRRDQSEQVFSNVFAVGDCATVEPASNVAGGGHEELPCTAQVAKQQAQYLAKSFNQLTQTMTPMNQLAPFQFRPLGSMAYIGGWQAVLDLKLPSHGERGQQRAIHESGRLAWLFWRSAYFSMAVSWRNKILIPMYWLLTWVFGRDISNI